MCAVCAKREPAIFDVKLGKALMPEECAVCELPGSSRGARRILERAVLQMHPVLRLPAGLPELLLRHVFCGQNRAQVDRQESHAEEAWMFHATSSMHVAGRCIGCGECERVCPVDIPVSELAREMGKIIKDRYDYEAGDPDQEAPLLGQFKNEDFDPGHHAE